MIGILLFVSVAFAYQITESDANCTSAYCSKCEAGKCRDCIDEYILVTENGVEKCVYKHTVQCQEVAEWDVSYCKKCVDGYRVEKATGKCVAGVETCGNYEMNKNKQVICAWCKEGFLMSENGCFDCSSLNPHCEKLYNGAESCSQCDHCKVGTQMMNDGKCKITDSHCKSFDEHGHCVKCFTGYYVDDKHVCRKGEIQNCRYYFNKTVCSECLNPTSHVENGKCVDGCADPNCSRCDLYNQTICSICKNGYVMNTTDSKCIKLPDNCLKVTLDYKNCTICADGYYLDANKKCVKCASTCVECEGAADKCTVCPKGQVLMQKADNTRICVKEVENCKTYDPTSTLQESKCTQCDQYYEVAEGGKKCSTKGCKKYISVNGTNNAKVEKCVLCLEGYYMKENFACEKCGAGCEADCVHEATKCPEEIKCDKFNKDGKCVKCVDEIFEIKDGKCVIKDLSVTDQVVCLDEMANGKCALCTKRTVTKIKQASINLDLTELNYKVTDVEFWPYDNELCTPSGSISMTILLALALLMILF